MGAVKRGRPWGVRRAILSVVVRKWLDGGLSPGGDRLVAMVAG